MTILRLRSLPWLLALGAVLLVGLFSYVTGQSYLERQSAVRETLASREALADTLSLLKDAETGVRGFLLTGDERFLEPYENARPRLAWNVDALGRLRDADPIQRAGIARVSLLTAHKLDLLRTLIGRKRAGQLVPEDTISTLTESKLVMDALREEIAQLVALANRHLNEREQAMALATLRVQLAVGAAILGAIALGVAGLASARSDAEQAQLGSERLERELAAREQVEIQLRDQTELLESVLTNIGDAVLVIDSKRKVLMMNPAHAKVVPYGVGVTLSSAWSKEVQSFLPDGKTEFPPEQGPLTRALQGHPSDGVEMVIRVRTGELRSYNVTTRPIASKGVTVAAVAVFRDSTELKLAEKTLLENEQRYRVLSEASFEGVAISKDGRILDSNANFAHWLGYESGDLAGVSGISLFPAEERERVQQLSQAAEVSYESKMQRRDGTTFPVEVRGRFATVRNERVRIAVIRDITERKQQEARLLEKSEQLRALSLRDELTGLHNRRGFMEVAEHQLKAAARARERCAVFFADLNGMKQINDQLGHEMGDHAIRAAGDVLSSVFRASDVVSRLGGDEFAVFAGECDELGVTVAFARIEHAVNELNEASGSRYRLSISAGAAVFDPTNPRDLASLMQAADANMYDVKRARHERGSLRVRSG